MCVRLGVQTNQQEKVSFKKGSNVGSQHDDLPLLAPSKLNELSEQVEQLRSAVQSNGVPHFTTTTATTSHSAASSASIHSVEQPGPSPRSARRESVFNAARQVHNSTGRAQNLDSIVCPSLLTQPTSETSSSLASGPKFHSKSASSLRSLEHITLSQEQIGDLFSGVSLVYTPM